MIAFIETNRILIALIIIIIVAIFEISFKRNKINKLEKTVEALKKENENNNKAGQQSQNMFGFNGITRLKHFVKHKTYNTQTQKHKSVFMNAGGVQPNGRNKKTGVPMANARMPASITFRARNIPPKKVPVSIKFGGMI